MDNHAATATAQLCVVDHTGRALCFVDESAAALKGTGSKKRQPSSRGSRTQRVATKTNKERHTTAASSDSDEHVQPAPHITRQCLPTTATADALTSTADDSDSFSPPVIEMSRQRLLHAARTSPSGHIKKCARVECSIREPDSPRHSEDDRPTRPLPLRTFSKDLKRKHVEVATSGGRGLPTTHHVHLQPQQTARRLPDLQPHMGPGHAEGTSRAARYPPF